MKMRFRISISGTVNASGLSVRSKTCVEMETNRTLARGCEGLFGGRQGLGQDGIPKNMTLCEKRYSWDSGRSFHELRS